MFAHYKNHNVYGNSPLNMDTQRVCVCVCACMCIMSVYRVDLYD